MELMIWWPTDENQLDGFHFFESLVSNKTFSQDLDLNVLAEYRPLTASVKVDMS